MPFWFDGVFAVVGAYPQKRHPLQDFGSEIGGGPIPRNRGWAYTPKYGLGLYPEIYGNATNSSQQRMQLALPKPIPNKL